MLIYDLIQEERSKRLYIKDKDEAVNYFEQQKLSLEAIKDTRWFKEIRDYWVRVVSACHDRMKTIKTEDIKKLQWELIAWEEFLTFLNNILAAELDKEDQDIL